MQFSEISPPTITNSFDKACWRTTTETDMRKLLLILTCLAVSACNTTKPMVSNAAKLDLQAASFAPFKSSTFPTRQYAPSETSAIEFINAVVKTGYDNHDPDRIAASLTPDFTYNYAVSAEDMVVSTANDYVKALDNWKVETRTGRRADIAIQSVNVRPNENEATVTAFVTYASKNFRPRFMETYTLVKQGSDWKLREWFSRSLRPARPELHDVEIFLTDFLERDEVDAIKAMLVARQPERTIAQLKAKEIKKLPNLPEMENDLQATLHVVFREPPQVGQSVRVQVLRYRDNPPDPLAHGFGMGYVETVEIPTPYFVSSGWQHFLRRNRNNAMMINVMVDGQVIASKTY